jgi:hypothetical protein
VVFGFQIRLDFYFLEGFGAEGFDGGLGGLFPLPDPDGFPVVLGPFGGL